MRAVVRPTPKGHSHLSVWLIHGIYIYIYIYIYIFALVSGSSRDIGLVAQLLLGGCPNGTGHRLFGIGQGP